jgi:hypothetical protein
MLSGSVARRLLDKELHMTKWGQKHCNSVPPHYTSKVSESVESKCTWPIRNSFVAPQQYRQTQATIHFDAPQEQIDMAPEAEHSHFLQGGKVIKQVRAKPRDQIIWEISAKYSHGYLKSWRDGEADRQKRLMLHFDHSHGFQRRETIENSLGEWCDPIAVQSYVSEESQTWEESGWYRGDVVVCKAPGYTYTCAHAPK